MSWFGLIVCLLFVVIGCGWLFLFVNSVVVLYRGNHWWWFLCFVICYCLLLFRVFLGVTGVCDDVF